MDIYTSDINNQNKYNAHEILKEKMPNISLHLRKILNNLPIKQFKSNNLNCNFDVYSDDPEILSKIKSVLANNNKYNFAPPLYLYFRPQQSVVDYERKLLLTDDAPNVGY